MWHTGCWDLLQAIFSSPLPAEKIDRHRCPSSTFSNQLASEIAGAIRTTYYMYLQYEHVDRRNIRLKGWFTYDQDSRHTHIKNKQNKQFLILWEISTEQRYQEHWNLISSNLEFCLSFDISHFYQLKSYGKTAV